MKKFRIVLPAGGGDRVRGQFTLEYGGVLSLWEEGERVFFRVEGLEDTGNLYKVWLAGGEGHEMLLGTPASERGALWLFRMISRKQLEYAGCWPVHCVRVEKIPKKIKEEEGQWYCERKPEELIPMLKGKEDREGGMLFCRNARGIWMAAPFSVGKPVVLSELFCFAVPKRIRGNWHLIWCFDREGNPKMMAQME